MQNSLSKLGNRLDGLELTVANMGSDSVPDKTVDVEAIIQEAQAEVESLAQAYETENRSISLTLKIQRRVRRFC